MLPHNWETRMNGKPEPEKVRGMIKSIGLSARGPNSGELTLNIEGKNYYAGIIDDKRSGSEGLEDGAYASYVSIATLAYSLGATVECTYMKLDKERIVGLVIP
jgi:hypothetical protein